MAPNDIPVGDTYPSIINKAIKGCACVLLILTEDSQSSIWVSKEIERALTYKKEVLPLAFEDIKLNDEFCFYLGNSQILPIQKIDESTDLIKKLISKLKFIIEQTNN